MDKRHSDALRNALEPLAYRRFATLSRKQFRHWVRAQRLGPNSWKEIRKHLPLGTSASDIMVIEDEDDILLIFAEKLSPLLDKID
jgi:hypothetical protein